MRLDVYLVEAGLSKSRSYAVSLIKGGLVTVDGKTVTKPSFDVSDESVLVTGEVHPYVGRGGVKLEGALDTFGIDVSGLVAVDIGASTGGFTDCLLKRGAKKVFAVDSGHGQLDESLKNDCRVVDLEGVNAKNLSRGVLPEKCDIAVCDVSFISQTYIIPEIPGVITEDGTFVTLIKPQFECGRVALRKGGIVKDKKYHYEAVKRVAECAAECGLLCCGVCPSPVEGGDGNREFLACFKKKCQSPIGDEQIKEAVS